MIALDTNVLVSLLVERSQHHENSTRWLSTVHQPLATTETNVVEWLRIVTHPRIFPDPTTLRPALALFRDFCESYGLRVLRDQEQWWDALPSLAMPEEWVRGNDVFDARVALCLRYHGVREIATRDADFTKYSFLRIVNPVA